ncbi:MAG: hypothetical protein IMHGJWDQ_000014 [Candidatus Fervidibacter sp.]
MRAEQLSHKFWLVLDSAKGRTVSTTVEGAMVTAILRSRDAFSCVVEGLTIQWLPQADWGTLTEQCARGLKALHRDFALVERDDVHSCALYRSPVSREVFWEAVLGHKESVTLTVRRFRLYDDGRNLEPFVLTEEQLAELLAEIVG